MTYRLLTNLGLLLTAVLFLSVLVPNPSWALGPTTRNCPTEPAQNVPISSGLTYNGSNCVLRTVGDVDSFQFNASASATYRIALGLGPSPTADVCVALYAPGLPGSKIFSGCTVYSPPYYWYSVVTNQKLTAAGLYTIVVSEPHDAVMTYALTLERLNPAPPEAVPLVLAQRVDGQVATITAQNSYTFSGNTAGEYQITATVPTDTATDVCFDVYAPDGSVPVSNACTTYAPPYYWYTAQANVTPSQIGTYVIVASTKGNDATVNYTLEVSCLLGNCSPTKCVLKDTLTYSSGTLTMDFTLGTPYAVTWNAWLVSGNTLQPLWSQAQPVTEPEVTITKTHAVPQSGVVGVLSTLTTPKKGITCSSWTVANTGTP